jgi:hypothetical protein
MKCLILVAKKNGPTMMARIGIMRALNRPVERVFNPSRKDPHWGKPKLKRSYENRLRLHPPGASCSEVLCCVASATLVLFLSWNESFDSTACAGSA